MRWDSTRAFRSGLVSLRARENMSAMAVEGDPGSSGNGDSTMTAATNPVLPTESDGDYYQASKVELCTVARRSLLGYFSYVRFVPSSKNIAASNLGRMSNFIPIAKSMMLLLKHLEALRHDEGAKRSAEDRRSERNLTADGETELGTTLYCILSGAAPPPKPAEKVSDR